MISGKKLDFDYTLGGINKKTQLLLKMIGKNQKTNTNICIKLDFVENHFLSYTNIL